MFSINTKYNNGLYGQSNNKTKISKFRRLYYIIFKLIISCSITKQNKHIIYNILKSFGKLLLRIFLIGLVLIILLSLSVQFVWIQDRLVSKAETRLSVELDTEVQITKLRLRMFSNLIAEDVFLADKEGDTLMKVGRIKADIAVFPLLRKQITLHRLLIEDSRLKLILGDDDHIGNIDFLTKAFNKPEKEKRDKQGGKDSWTFDIQKVKLQDLIFHLEILRDSLEMNFAIGSMKLNFTDMKLDPLLVMSERINIRNTDFQLTDHGSGNRIVANINSASLLYGEFGSENFHLGLEEFECNVQSLDIQQVRTEFGIPAYNHVNLDEISLDMSELFLSDDTLAIQIHHVYVKNLLDFGSLRLSGQAHGNRKNVTLNKLLIRTENSYISANLSRSRTEDIPVLKTSSSDNYNLSIHDADISLQDLQQYFGPSIADTLLPSSIEMDLDLSVNADVLDLQELVLHAKDSSFIVAGGRLLNPFEPEDWLYQVEIDSAFLSQKGSGRIMSTNLLPEQIDLRHSLSFHGGIAGRKDTIDAELFLKKGQGQLQGSFKYCTNEHADQITAQLKLQDLDLEDFIPTSELSKVNMTADIELRRYERDKIEFAIGSHISSLEYRSYPYRAIDLTAVQKGSAGFFQMESHHPGTDIITALEWEKKEDIYSGHLKMNIADLDISQVLDYEDPKGMAGLIDADFAFGRLDGPERFYDLAMYIPSMSYGSMQVDSVTAFLKASPDSWQYNLQLPLFIYDTFEIDHIMLSGYLQKKELRNTVSIRDSLNAEKYKITFGIDNSKENEWQFDFMDESIILNYNEWTVADGGMMLIGADGKLKGDMRLQRFDEQLEINADKRIRIKSSNYQLSNLSAILNKENALLDGSLNGEMVLGQETMNIDLQVSDLRIGQHEIGDVGILLNSLADEPINFSIEMEKGENQLIYQGEYLSAGFEHSELDSRLKADITDLSILKEVSGDIFIEAGGEVHADIRIKGKTRDLQSTGFLSLKNVFVETSNYGNRYQLADEKILLDGRKLILEEFTIRDRNKQPFILNGSIGLNEVNKIDVDIKLDSRRFALLDKESGSDPGIYGKLITNMQAVISGTVSELLIDSKIDIVSGTDLTYIFPPKKIGLVSHEGIVDFGSANDRDSLKNTGTVDPLVDTLLSPLKGIHLSAQLNISDSANFRLDIDPRSGDFISIRGNGDLDFELDESGEPRLYGSFGIVEGLYEVSYYSLVRKTFEITEGSTVAWAGEFENPDLNISATNLVRTASLGLVANELTYVGEEDRKQYARPIPYMIKMSIGGKPDDLILQFEIDLEDEERSALPLVDEKLKRLHEAGNESLLTQQIFGLLALNTFIPEQSNNAGFSSGTALATSAATTSLNGLLSRELNKLSGQIIKGGDFQVGLQSFQDLSGEGDNNNITTTMDIRYSKLIFNERVTIEAGKSFDISNKSPESSTNAYDMAIIYDIGKQSNMKLKLFTKSSYDMLFKDINTSGIALIFIKEYDQIRKKEKVNKKKY